MCKEQMDATLFNRNENDLPTEGWIQRYPENQRGLGD